MAAPKMSYAVRDGRLIHISEVTSGRQTDCTCPVCAELVIAKKGAVMQHHFAHDQGTACSVESVLHQLGKTLIYEGVKRSLALREPVPLQWGCDRCGDQHTGNLIKRATAVALEVPMGPARPDVLLYDSEGKPIVAIEVVVSHPPEPEARAFCNDRGIDLLVVELAGDTGIEELRAWSGLKAKSGTRCMRRKCPACRHPLMPSPLRVVAGDCYRCGAPMKIAFKSEGGAMTGPEEFADEDVRLARAAGCQLGERYSQTTQSRYLANICGKCGAFTGSFYLHDFWYLPDVAPERSPETYCPDCGRYFD